MADTMKDAIANTKSLRRTLRSLIAVADVVDGIADLESTVQGLEGAVGARREELAEVEKAIALAEADRKSTHESLVRAKEDVRVATEDAARARNVTEVKATEAEAAVEARKKEANSYFDAAKKTADEKLAQINSEIELRLRDNDDAMEGYEAQRVSAQAEIDSLRAEFEKLVKGIRK